MSNNEGLSMSDPSRQGSTVLADDDKLSYLISISYYATT